MLYFLECVCTDYIGTWQNRPSAEFFANDIEAKTWAKKELIRLRERFADIKFENVRLFEDMIDTPNRLICALN